MLKTEYMTRLRDAAHVEIYLSGMDGARIEWPWRMLPPKSATASYRDACETLVVDSDPLDDDVGATDVLDCAHRLDAEVASLADVYHDKDATVDALLRGLEVADDHAFDGTLLLPLQKPFVECWREVGEPTDHWLGIGGLKDARDSKRLTAAQTLRPAVGPDVWLHGFGWGVKGLARDIRENPKILNSVDYSTPMQDITFDYASGTESKSVAAARAGAQLIEDLRSVSGLIDAESHEQSTLG